MFITSDNTFFNRDRDYEGSIMRVEPLTRRPGIAEEAHNAEMDLREVYRVPSTLSSNAYIDQAGNLISVNGQMIRPATSKNYLPLAVAIAAALIGG